MPQYPGGFGGGLGGLYPGGTQGLYPGMGGGFGVPGFGVPQGQPGFGGQQPGFGGQYPGQGPPQGQYPPQGPPPGQYPPQGQYPGPPQGPPQGPPPGQGAAVDVPDTPVTQAPPAFQPVQPEQPAEEVEAAVSVPSTPATSSAKCGVGRNKIKYNEDGEEIEQIQRITGKHPLRVAGGWPADRNEWPWIAMMMNRGRQFCDGSIIDEYHILTAAHCVAQMRKSDVASLKVRLGAHNLQNSANEAGVQDIGVKLVVKHKDFTMETLHSDIAILA